MSVAERLSAAEELFRESRKLIKDLEILNSVHEINKILEGKKTDGFKIDIGWELSELIHKLGLEAAKKQLSDELAAMPNRISDALNSPVKNTSPSNNQP